MASVVTPPKRATRKGFKIFLAGAIDMGRALDWQSWVIEQLRKEPGLILLNPRRADFTPDKLDEQIMWELRELEEADIILMWFPARSEAPISLLETGLYMKSGKLILGVEEGYYRKRNLELTAQYYNVPVHLTLDSLIAEIMRQHKLVAA